ncbi:MAG: GNAT family N-acetyltransferase [Candidatus Acidiferrales bacterium]
MERFALSVRYCFVRGRQLEGAFPGKKEMGVWPITSYRIGYGWGLPPEEVWPYGDSSVWPSPEPPGVDAAAKSHRSAPYRRVRTMQECVVNVSRGLGVGASLSITEKWANPPNGRIPAPSADDIPFPMHFVYLTEFDPVSQEFRFRNSWGPAWGDQGYGYISADILDTIWSEAWEYIDVDPMMFVTQFPGNQQELASSDTFPQLKNWKIKNSDESILHWFHLIDETDERMAWVSALERDNALEIEELFVRPQFRGVGHGKRLFSAIHKRALDRGLSFKMWISFADILPGNLAVIERVVAPFGLGLQASGVRWSPLVAAPIWSKRTQPVQNFVYSDNPPAIPAAVMRLVAEFLVATVAIPVGTFIYDAIRSWANPRDPGKIRVRIGNLDVETTQMSTEEFRKLLTEVMELKHEDEIISKLIATGASVTIVERRK